MKKIVLLIIGIIFVVGCQKIWPTKPAPKAPLEITNKHCELSAFNSALISGNAKVEIARGSYGIDITGIQKNNYSCPKISANQLIYSDKDNNKNINAIVRITAPELKNIIVADNATVSVRNLNANNLTVVVKNNGAINFEGQQFNISKISQSGGGKINIDWVNTNSLIVEGDGSGSIYLAGQANNLLVRLTQNARLFARYLRTQKTQAFTTDRALAELFALDTLSAYAIDKSNIYYYKRPKNLTIVTRDWGNVLYHHWVK